jgi:hypothetical protein
MRLKHVCFDSESVQLFEFKKSRDRLHTKNVHEASVLRLAGATRSKIAARKSLQAKGETACAISPEYAVQRLRLRVGLFPVLSTSAPS